MINADKAILRDNFIILNVYVRKKKKESLKSMTSASTIKKLKKKKGK